jgi:prepilin-type N-terminal cleavage/methylation domain-containing protein
MKNLKKNSKGFTIIEVLIVLAIAGLIMLVVFLAVPALQRNARNTQRKSDVSAILGSVSEYTSNNAGALPIVSGQFTASFVNTTPKLGFYDNTTATNVTYGYSAATRGAIPAVPVITSNDVVNVYNNLKCASATTATLVGASSRSIAALYNIEGSNGNVLQCQES